MVSSERKCIAAAAAVTAYLKDEEQAATVAIPAAFYDQLGDLYQQLKRLFDANDGGPASPNTTF
jgi:hypothetical protein